MAHEVFISHSSLDKTVADAVCAALENTAIRCWIAPRDLQPGRSFAGEITRAIQRSKVMVLIFSAHSNTSEQILREVQLAANSHLHIVQFRIADVIPNDDLEYYLSAPHWLDALTPPLENNLQRLGTSVKALLEMAAEDPAKRAMMPVTPSVDSRPERSQQDSVATAMDPTTTPVAQTDLGLLYQRGEDVPKDFDKAAELYQKVANQGYAPAQNYLGRLYEQGKGVPKDLDKAAELYQKAADQGNQAAIGNLKTLRH